MGNLILDSAILSAMETVLDEARVALADGDLPYAAVVVDASGRIVARTRDTITVNNDPTRHAEFDVVRLAVGNVGPDLSGCTLVSNGEPCAMCSSAAWWAGIRHIVYGVSMEELVRVAPRSMPEPFGPLEDLNERLQDKFEIRSGVMRKESLKLWDVEDDD